MTDSEILNQIERLADVSQLGIMTASVKITGKWRNRHEVKPLFRLGSGPWRYSLREAVEAFCTAIKQG